LKAGGCPKRADKKSATEKSSLNKKVLLSLPTRAVTTRVKGVKNAAQVSNRRCC
jgi:hypothetical protein